MGKDAVAFGADQLGQRQIKTQTLLPVGYINTLMATKHRVPGCPFLSAGHYSRGSALTDSVLVPKPYLSSIPAKSRTAGCKK